MKLSGEIWTAGVKTARSGSSKSEIKAKTKLTEFLNIKGVSALKG
jgi:hypothetical protein